MKENRTRLKQIRRALRGLVRMRIFTAPPRSLKNIHSATVLQSAVYLFESEFRLTFITARACVASLT